MNKLLVHATTWMDLMDVILSGKDIRRLRTLGLHSYSLQETIKPQRWRRGLWLSWDRNRVGMKWAGTNGSMKESLCSDGTDLYLDCGDGFTNLFMG